MDTTIQQDIERKASAAPRVTNDQVEAAIASQHYFTAAQALTGGDTMADAAHPLNRLTFCVLVLSNGFTVTGESACASPENFDADIGKRIARENAVRKVWPLLGYELRTELSQPGLTQADAAADLAGVARPNSQATA